MDNSVIFVTAIAIVCLLAVAYYWGLQILQKTRLSFWDCDFDSPLAPDSGNPGPQSTGLDLFIGRTGVFHGHVPGVTVLALLFLSLILLVTLHRVADLRRLWVRMQSLQLDSIERTRIATAELLTMGGLVGVSLAATGLLLTGGLAVAQMSDLLSRSPWTVLTVGALGSHSPGRLHVLLDPDSRRGLSLQPSDRSPLSATRAAARNTTRTVEPRCMHDRPGGAGQDSSRRAHVRGMPASRII